MAPVLQIEDQFGGEIHKLFGSDALQFRGRNWSCDVLEWRIEATAEFRMRLAKGFGGKPAQEYSTMEPLEKALFVDDVETEIQTRISFRAG
jgi:hypothetical protein